MKYFYRTECERAVAKAPRPNDKNMNQKTFLFSLTLSAMLMLLGASATGQKELSFEESVKVVAEHRGWTAAQVEAETVGFEEAALLHAGMRVLESPAKAIPHAQPLPGSPNVSLALRLLQSEFRPVPGSFTWLETEEGVYVVLPSQERFTVLVERMKLTNR